MSVTINYSKPKRTRASKYIKHAFEPQFEKEFYHSIFDTSSLIAQTKIRHMMLINKTINKNGWQV